MFIARTPEGSLVKDGNRAMDSENSQIKAMKALIADDSRPMRATLRSFLQQLGVSKVTTVSEGLAARELLDREDFDLLLLDQDMPKLTGLELLISIRQSKPDLKIIMITAAGDVRTVGAAIEQGCDGYIIKPVSIGVLNRRIRQLTQAQSPSKELLKELCRRFRELKAAEEWTEALQLLRDATRQDQGDRDLLMLTGEVYEKIEEDENALECYRKAAELSRGLLPGPLEKIARALAKRGELKEAIEFIGRSVRVSHASMIGPRLQFYAQLLTEDGRIEEASAVMRQLADKPSALAEAAGRQLERLGRIDGIRAMNAVGGVRGK